jgi:hypothetical protein
MACMSDEAVAVRRHVATEVRVAMVRHDYTQDSLAHALGMSTNWLGARLTLHKPFNTDELAALSRVLDVPLPMLLPDASAINHI